jgi:hypothetical protein
LMAMMAWSLTGMNSNIWPPQPNEWLRRTFDRRNAVAVDDSRDTLVSYKRPSEEHIPD